MYRGVLYMLLASFSFALVNFLVKILSDHHELFPEIQNYPEIELVFFRSIISLTICFAIIKSRKIPFFGVNKKWLIIRGFAGFVSLTLFFYTIANIPLAIATIIQYLSPIFTIIIAIYLNKQKVNPIQWLFFAISMTGVVIIGLGDNSADAIDPFWIGIGLLSALISGIAYNSIIKCSTTDKPITVVMYFPLIAAPITFVLLWINGFIIPKGIEWVLLGLIGIITQIAQVSMTRAFNAANAASVTPIKYFGAIYALLFGFFIFNETLSLYASIGIVFILVGVLLNTFLKDRILKLKFK